MKMSNERVNGEDLADYKGIVIKPLPKPKTKKTSKKK